MEQVGDYMKDETKWYRCTTRNEMINLIIAGFNYTNFRKDKYNNNNNVFYFERTSELENYLIAKN